ncbi:MAG: VOC family protein [Dermatophilaceae bacterium]
MVFWQLTIDSNDPARLARFWEQALGYVRTPPQHPATTWDEHYRGRLDGRAAFEDRIFDPQGLRPPVWFQQVPEGKGGKNRLHLDLYPTGRDDTLSMPRRIERVDARVDELVAIGATAVHRAGGHPDDGFYYVVMADPEGNEFCIG